MASLRGLESDHKPDGWPAVRMRQISALCNEVDRLQAALPRWIPITERLPTEEDGTFAVKFDDGGVLTAWSDCIPGEFKFPCDVDGAEVVAWCPLPQN